MNECNICLDRTANVNCFGTCTIHLCLSCFNTLLKLNVCKDIEYCCPQCRITSVKNKDRRFTIFLQKHKSTLKKIISLYEPIIETNVSSQTSHRWDDWTARITREQFQQHMREASYVDWQRLNSEQLAEITYYDFESTNWSEFSDYDASGIDIYGIGI